ncbi:glycosyltransferase [Senegalia massiliensis]|jgi:glycosyltransferase involved in cell wall biosynthesis|uniref:glycosyltransferase n=1 Tax=Senegalia massiliensis TaxID=1720316 RepID=UPI0010326992|nr:glycosyltransferase [Senegalia massiliensis]
MKILFFAPANVNHTVRWVNAMVNKGHAVYLISLRDHKEGVNKIDKKVKIYYLPYSGLKGYYLNFLKAKSLVKKISPDIINTHYASGYGTLSRLVNYQPTLLSVWGSDVYEFPYESKFKEKILKKNLMQPLMIASTSRAMANQTKKFMNKEANIYVTPFGVDTNLFKPIDVDKNDDIINIGLVKTLKTKYGIKYLIEATRILIDKLNTNGYKEIANRIRTNIYGEGPKLNDLQELTKSLNLSDIVNFKGYVENTKIPLVLNHMDIFCAPSLLESFGVAAVEAMACEIPVVASDVDGFKEVIEDSKTGYIFKSKNSKEIAEKLYELVLNKSLRDKFGKNGRERVLNLYDWNKNVALMEDVYKNTLKQIQKL